MAYKQFYIKKGSKQHPSTAWHLFCTTSTKEKKMLEVFPSLKKSSKEIKHENWERPRLNDKNENYFLIRTNMKLY